MKRINLLILVALASIVGAAWAANTSSTLLVGGVGRVTLSVDGDSAVVDELDPGSSKNKRAAVVNFKVHDRDVVLLVRMQHANNGLFLDIVADNTIGEVTTRTTAMNLSSRSHPSPTKDAVDTAILTAAAAD